MFETAKQKRKLKSLQRKVNVASKKMMIATRNLSRFEVEMRIQMIGVVGRRLAVSTKAREWNVALENKESNNA